MSEHIFIIRVKGNSIFEDFSGKKNVVIQNKSDYYKRVEAYSPANCKSMLLGVNITIAGLGGLMVSDIKIKAVENRHINHTSHKL